jgi:hypothetical protein
LLHSLQCGDQTGDHAEEGLDGSLLSSSSLLFVSITTLFRLVALLLFPTVHSP